MPWQEVPQELRAIVALLTPSDHDGLIDVGNTTEFESQRQRFSPRTKLSNYLLTSARAGVSGAAALGGSEVAMPERASSFASAFIAGALAAAALLGISPTASLAAECLENPDLRITQPGHWYYHSDRTQNRRCWYFEPTEAPATTPNAAAPPAPVAAANDAPQQSFLSRLAAGLSQNPSSPPPQQREIQQNGIPDNSGEAAQTISPKPAKPEKAVRRERPDIAPPPTTTGAATAERHDPPRQPGADKNEKRDPPLNVAEREALFQDFMKWQLERSVFGHP